MEIQRSIYRCRTPTRLHHTVNSNNRTTFIMQPLNTIQNGGKVELISKYNKERKQSVDQETSVRNETAMLLASTSKRHHQIRTSSGCPQHKHPSKNVSSDHRPFAGKKATVKIRPPQAALNIQSRSYRVCRSKFPFLPANILNTTYRKIEETTIHPTITPNWIFPASN